MYNSSSLTEYSCYPATARDLCPRGAEQAAVPGGGGPSWSKGVVYTRVYCTATTAYLPSTCIPYMLYITHV